MVNIFKERKALVLQWDAGDYDGPVSIRTSSASDLDGSSTELVSNPGFAAVSYPLEFEGVTDVEILDQDGNVLDSGSFSVS